MKFFLDNWVLILAAITSGTLLFLPNFRNAGGGLSVPASEAVRLMNREKAVLVDVCDAAEFAKGHAGGSRNIPLGELETSKNLPSNKATPVVLMCATGSRSSRAAAQLRRAGYEKAVAVTGGLNAWRDAQLPVEKAA